MMKTLLFKLMMIISIAWIGGISARAENILKVVRINPGDTVSTDSLTRKLGNDGTGTNDGMDLILIKNGGDCIIKMSNMEMGSFHSPYGALICTDSTVFIPAIADSYHFFYK